MLFISVEQKANLLTGKASILKLKRKLMELAAFKLAAAQINY
jgi:hypothetical protein